MIKIIIKHTAPSRSFGEARHAEMIILHHAVLYDH